ncbi:MAG: histidine--tRNA ligase [Spirochaetes bacterium]|nr:histidine--tRNA ligase [Spirochaetota bacterium]
MLSRPPGIEDVFPDRVAIRDGITSTARDAFRLAGYREIIIPVIEFTEVFARGIGDDTDIVSKEMFTFEDRGGRSLTLRPEGTASVVRAYVENGDYNRLSTCKLFYMGPMFRAERPQKGRLRQFNQFGAECFGSGDPWYDFEIIAMMDSIARRVGIRDHELLINSIGCPSCRSNYVDELRSYYQGKTGTLCRDCGARLDRNPLRLLDCKEESCREPKTHAPRITDFLCEGCRDHHLELKRHLDAARIPYTEDHLLVRGLDYYTRTTFEFVSSALGGQNAFAAGGRYDNMVELFGGRATPAVGFAAGIERMELLVDGREAPSRGSDVYLVHSGGPALERAQELCMYLRDRGISADLEPSQTGFRAQFKKADREGARVALIIGEDELASGTCTIKDLKSGEQDTLPGDSLHDRLLSLLREGGTPG